MKILKTIQEYKEWLESVSGEIGFVPTMGALHKGHLSLIQQAKKESDLVVVSIYVNPLQFNEIDDFNSYPRTLEKDLRLCEKEKVDVVFVPSIQEMYINTSEKKISSGELGKILEGKSRPGHFDGVCIIVKKLFDIIKPSKAFFGTKDFQQLIIIEKMVKELNLPVKIVRCETIREEDGLALSSRNIHLTKEEREQAIYLSKSLFKAKQEFEEGQKNPEKLKEIVLHELKNASLAKIDYVNIVNEDLKEVEEVRKGNVIVLALWFGTTRLIDNIIL